MQMRAIEMGEEAQIHSGEIDTLRVSMTYPKMAVKCGRTRKELKCRQSLGSNLFQNLAEVAHTSKPKI